MTTVAWPSHLPSCPASWREQDNPDMVVTEVDVGEPLVRRRSSILRRNVEVEWTMNAELYQQFLEFYETTCASGVNDFPFPNPITKAVNNYRFTEAPSITFLRGSNRVSAFTVSCKWSLLT